MFAVLSFSYKGRNSCSIINRSRNRKL